jgi:hypothetical protein
LRARAAGCRSPVRVFQLTGVAGGSGGGGRLSALLHARARLQGLRLRAPCAQPVRGTRTSECASVARSRVTPPPPPPPQVALGDEPWREVYPMDFYRKESGVHSRRRRSGGAHLPAAVRAHVQAPGRTTTTPRRLRRGGHTWRWPLRALHKESLPAGLKRRGSGGGGEAWGLSCRRARSNRPHVFTAHVHSLSSNNAPSLSVNMPAALPP